MFLLKVNIFNNHLFLVIRKKKNISLKPLDKLLALAGHSRKPRIITKGEYDFFFDLVKDPD